MSPEAYTFITAIAFFFIGVGLGYLVRLQQHVNEVEEWKAIARKAQRLNSLADTLEQERSADAQRQYKN